MNSKKLIAAFLSVILIALTFAACSSKEPPSNDKAVETPPETLVLNGESTEEVTAITGSVDENGNVIDNEGIVDNDGHKVYYTGHNNDDGKKIYTTGKKDANGNILYTLNTTDDRGNLIYFTGKFENGKLVLDKTNAVPDYTTDKNSTLDTNHRYTKTSTVSYSAPEIENKATEIRQVYMNYTEVKGDDTLKKIVPAEDGGYIAIGFSMAKSGIYADVNKSWNNFGNVLKFSEDGKLEWVYSAGGDGQIDFADVIELKDGSIVAAGYTLATDTDAPLRCKLNSSLIVKLSADGEYIWSYSFPGDENSNGDYISSLCATDDGGFLAGGRADSTSGFFTGTQSDYFKAFLFKFDKNGEVDWRKTLGGSRGNTIEAIDVNEDGTIFALCVTLSNDGSFTAFKGYNNQTANTAVLCFEKDGSLKWTKNLMSSGISEFKAIDATNDGGCLVGGKFSIYKRADGSFTTNFGETDGYVVKYDKNGGVCWSRIIGGRDVDEIYAIAETPNGIVVSGRTKSGELDFSATGNDGGYDGFVMVIDNKGATIGTTTLAGKGDDIVADIAAYDGGIAMVGWSDSTDGDFAKNPVSGDATGFWAKYDFVTE